MAIARKERTDFEETSLRVAEHVMQTSEAGLSAHVAAGGMTIQTKLREVS